MNKKIERYEVKYNDTFRVFLSFDYALAFYETLDCGKALWDITGMPELLLSSNQTGHGGKITTIEDLINNS
jgi:hypothetical protein